MRKIIILFLLISGMFPAAAAGEKIVTGGEGPTKREALMEAQRKAVEQGVGVLVDSQSLAENLMLVEDKIYSKSRGYVKNYSVISEKKIGDGNWKVVLECEVETEKIKDSLNAIGILREKMGNPRIIVVYDSSTAGGINDQNVPVASATYDGIVEYLCEREYPVVDKKVSDLLMQQKIDSSADIYKKSLKLGLNNQAEYLLVYDIKLHKEEPTDIFQRGFVLISAKIINLTTGRVYAGQGKKVMGIDKNSLDFAFLKAGRKAGRLAAKFLEQKLLERWQTDTVSGRPIILEILNVKDFSILIEFKEELKKSYGVRNVSRRQSIEKSVEYEITHVGDIDTLRDNIYKIFKSMGVKVMLRTSSGDKISYEIMKESGRSKKR